MLSHADRGRVAAERVMRGAALALMLFAMWRLLQPAPAGSAVYLASATLDHGLPRLIASRTPVMHLSLSSVPTAASRDALGALRHAGVAVTWNGRGTPFAPLALGVERVLDPSASVRITTTSNGSVELRDALSVIDTVAAAHGSTVIAGEPSGSVRATAGTTLAIAAVAPATTQHPVLVIGRASWESKFTIAALEEAGWHVAARVSIAPGADVTQDAAAPLDTAKYSAVVALDSVLGSAGAELARYVRAGGGLVLVGDAPSAGAVRDIAPAQRAERRPSSIMTFDVNRPLQSLPSSRLIALRGDAVPLEERDGALMIAARREGAGRVVQIGYDELWRWRMQGGDSGPAGHRAWWSRIVAGVVSAPIGTADAVDEGAPVARLFNALGAPTLVSPARAPDESLPVWLLPMICALLLAEWGSRRIRGAP